MGPNTPRRSGLTLMTCKTPPLRFVSVSTVLRTTNHQYPSEGCGPNAARGAGPNGGNDWKNPQAKETTLYLYMIYFPVLLILLETIFSSMLCAGGVASSDHQLSSSPRYPCAVTHFSRCHGAHVPEIRALSSRYVLLFTLLCVSGFRSYYSVLLLGRPDWSHFSRRHTTSPLKRF
ncbi:hypothetical protein BJV74DRAFT_271342 [Russula compacta]|nr:hypothetical protein BJV74DRAFT_271342 [Russula compacta]